MPGERAGHRRDLRDRIGTNRGSHGAGVKDARAAVRDLAWDAQRLTGLNPTVAILEFACGASNALDEYTVFLTPGQPLDDPAVLQRRIGRLRHCCSTGRTGGW